MIAKSAWLAASVLAALVVWAPLPFGSVGPTARACLQISAGAALALAAAAAGPLTASLRRVRSGAGACLAIALLGLVGSLTYSIAPAESRAAARDWLAAAAALVAGAAVGVSRRRRRLLAASFAVVVAFEVVYGVRNWLMGSREIWGVWVQSQAHRVKGTFVNPNHLATFLLLGLAAAGAWLWWALRRARGEPRAGVRAVLVVPALVFWAGLFVCLILTGSRSGILGAGAGLAAQVLIAASTLARRRLALPALAGLVLVGVVAVMTVAGGQAFDRLLQTRSSDVSAGARLEAAEAGLRLVVRRPVLGFGLGSFEDAFPAVIPPSQVGFAWLHLHNDPLELTITVGFVGLALAVLGVAGLWRRLAKLTRLGVSSEDRAAGLFGLGALASLGVQELFEFGLTIPANGFVAAALIGAAAGARLARSTDGAGPAGP